MKKFKRVVLLLLICISISFLYGCSSEKYETLAGEYEGMSVETESVGITYNKIEYSVLILDSSGKYSFVFRIKSGIKLQIAGADTTNDVSDDVFLEGEYLEDGAFSADTTSLTIASGMLQGSHVLKTKRIELNFKILTVSIKGLYLFNGK